jgi:hypothetical protein
VKKIESCKTVEPKGIFLPNFFDKFCGDYNKTLGIKIKKNGIFIKSENKNVASLFQRVIPLGAKM